MFDFPENPQLLKELRHIRANQLVMFRLIFEILKKEDLLMADANSILAKITANTSVLSSVATAVTALENGQTTISAEIDALKAQVAAAGAPVDFTALDAAADSQAQVISGLATAIPANTPAAT